MRNLIFVEQNVEETYKIGLCAGVSLLSQMDTASLLKRHTSTSFPQFHSFSLVHALRVLCYELLREKPNIHLKLLLALLGPNPNILDSKSNSLLVLTMASVIRDCIMNAPESSDQKQNIEIYNTIEKHCGWDTIVKPVDEVIDILVNALKEYPENSEEPTTTILSSYDFEIVKSLEIISRSKSWRWMYSNLLVNRLWPFLKPPKTQKDNKINTIIFSLIGVLGRVGLMLEGENKNENEGVNLLRKRLSIVLTKTGQKSKCLVKH